MSALFGWANAETGMPRAELRDTEWVVAIKAERG